MFSLRLSSFAKDDAALFATRDNPCDRDADSIMAVVDDAFLAQPSMLAQYRDRLKADRAEFEVSKKQKAVVLSAP